VRTPISATGSDRHASMRVAVLADRLSDDFSRPASVTLPGSRVRMSSAGGSQRCGVSPGPVVRAARGCSNSLDSSAVAFRTPPTPVPSTHAGPARPADLVAAFAVDASDFAGASGTITNPSSLTRTVCAVPDEGAPGQAGQGRREDGERTHSERMTESAGPRTLRCAVPGASSLLTGHLPPVSAHQLCTTAVRVTPHLKSIGCDPKSVPADRTQSTHDRKEQS
jgi:hypothetical protein